MLQKVFDLLSSKSECSWNALINGYVRSGEFNRALILYKHMLEDSKHPSSFTFVALLRVCTRKKDLNTGRDLHAGIAKEGLLQSNVFVGNALIDMYAKCGSLREAQEVFDVLPVHNVVTWTALIAGYAFNSQAEEALKYFEKMRHDNVVPNAVTYASTLKACGCTKNVKLGKEIHAETEQKGILQTNQYVGNALVDMYARCGMLAKAKSVFSKLKVRDRVSWNALIAGHVEQEQGKKALILYKQMRTHGVSPDVITYTCALRACGTIGAIDEGIQIHNELKESGIGKKDVFIGSALVDMYSKCGALVKADEVFNQLPSPDALTWTALITGYAQQAEIDIALSYFDRMRKAGVKPDQITFLSVLTACNHAGLVDKGEQYYEVMWKDYGLSPSIKHHSCLVDLLGRAGQLDRLMTIMNKTPFQPTMVMWLNVMTACRKWGDVHLGRQAFEQAIRLDSTESAAYVCMANIYADAGMYENAKEIEWMIMTE
ncbi:hypothetical protein KP509_14G076900 [Ceratopteris richardii]|uniref:Pentatricopeptide repeat-containing protein n=1 Tax=Ceratopteris richardii TaxID=49495 RepID=A0A8T2TBE0_CERRI|nr:hypothetical protein KP509_14G076900 [Ceratopteris richardii]